MPSSARATIIGHLGGDPEQRQTPNGTTVLNFSVATSRRRGQQETTTWWRVSAFGQRAEGLAILTSRGLLAKGALVQVTGEAEQRFYTDRNDNERSSLDINADDVVFLIAPKNAQTTDDDSLKFDEVPF